MAQTATRWVRTAVPDDLGNLPIAPEAWAVQIDDQGAVLDAQPVAVIPHEDAATAAEVEAAHLQVGKACQHGDLAEITRGLP